MDFDQARVLNEVIRAICIRHRGLAGVLLAPLGLHPGQEILLLDLDARGPRTQGELAASAGCEPPTITNSVRRLEASGLVVRRPSPTDGRVTIVELSESGQALMPRLRGVWEQLAEQAVGGLASTPLEQLIQALGDLAASLTSVGARTCGEGAVPRDVA